MTKCAFLLSIALLLGCSSSPATRTDDGGPLAVPTWEDASERFPGPCEIEVDTDLDGEIEQHTVKQYWPDGGLISSVELGDGELVAYQYTYRSTAGERRVERYEFASNRLEYREVEYYEGDRLVRTVDSWTFPESGGTTECRLEYDDGHLVSNRCNNDVSGVSIYRYWTDDRGWILSVDLDGPASETFQPDGMPDERQIFSYDADGRILVAETDSGVDGTIDMVESHTYDEWGNPTSHSVMVREYDAARNLVAQAALESEEIRYVHHYDGVGNLRLTEVDFGADGVAERTMTYSYDCWE